MEAKAAVPGRLGPGQDAHPGLLPGPEASGPSFTLCSPYSHRVVLSWGNSEGKYIGSLLTAGKCPARAAGSSVTLCPLGRVGEAAAWLCTVSPWLTQGTLPAWTFSPGRSIVR